MISRTKRFMLASVLHRSCVERVYSCGVSIYDARSFWAVCRSLTCAKRFVVCGGGGGGTKDVQRQLKSVLGNEIMLLPFYKSASPQYNTYQVPPEVPTSVLSKCIANVESILFRWPE